MGLFDKLFGQKKAIKESTVSVKSEEEKISNIGDDIPSLESRIKNSYPSKNGLYPHEILMLEYAESYKTGKNSFQSFWKWNYSVLQPQKVLDSLYARGFICIGDVDKCIDGLKVTELKEMLSNKGEKTTGKKAELIDRILENYDKNELEKIFKERNYALTELGKQELEENKYVIYSHGLKYISVWEMNVLMNSADGNLSYRDVLWGELNRQCLQHMKDRNFGLYRNTKLYMHDFLVEEEKYLNALKQLVEVIAYDLSGLGNSEGSDKIFGNDIKKRIEFKLVNLYFDQETNEVIILPYLLKCFEKLKKELKASDDEIIELVYDTFKKIQINNRVFDEDECANILLYQLGLEDKNVDNSYSNAFQKIENIIKKN